MELGLAGKRVIITGATKGIGRAIAELMLEEGASLAFCARNEAEVKAAEEEWKKKGHTVFGAACDVAEKYSYKVWLEKAIGALGGVDIFIPNVSAGLVHGDESWQASFNVDLMGVVTGCETVLPFLTKSEDGSIVVITSMAALEVVGGPSSYNTIKAGLITYASQLGEVAAPHGVRVNCVSPGPIHVDGGFWGDMEKTQQEVYQAVCNRHPSGRLGTTNEVAKAVVFLSSPAASWITRTNMIVDGGFSRRIQF